MLNHSTLTTDTVLPGWTGEVDRDLLRNFLGDLDLSDSEDDDLEDELDEDADLILKKNNLIPFLNTQINNDNYNSKLTWIIKMEKEERSFFWPWPFSITFSLWILFLCVWIRRWWGLLPASSLSLIWQSINIYQFVFDKIGIWIEKNATSSLPYQNWVMISLK